MVNVWFTHSPWMTHYINGSTQSANRLFIFEPSRESVCRTSVIHSWAPFPFFYVVVLGAVLFNSNRSGFSTGRLDVSRLKIWAVIFIQIRTCERSLSLRSKNGIRLENGNCIVIYMAYIWDILHIHWECWRYLIIHRYRLLIFTRSWCNYLIFF